MGRFKAIWFDALPALVIIAGVLLVQIFLITRPLDFLLTNIFPDDAFYYFEIARHIAQGAGSTFDGLTATNGYHPLWMLILVPLYTFFGTSVGVLEPIRAALVLSVLFNAGTGYLVWRILGRITLHRFARTFGFALWALNPFLFYQSINGLETSISLFLVALLFWYTFILAEHISLMRLIMFGIIGGLSILARIDTAVYVAAILLWLWLRDMSRQSFKHTVQAGAVVTLCVLPWLWWNVTRFGMLLTSSSGANTLVNHTLIYQDNGTGAYQTIKGIFYILESQLHELTVHTGAPELTLLLFGSALTLLIAGAWTLPQRLRDVPPAYAFALGFLLLFFLNVTVRWTGRPWYFVSFGILLAMLGALSVDTIRIHWVYGERVKRYSALALCGLLAASYFVWWHKELTYPALQHREMYATALWLGDNLPDARVGVFNAGIQGYFSTAQVINLDGLVNNPAYHAMQDKTLFAYLQENSVTHLADFPIYLTYRYKSFWGIPDITAHLSEIHTVRIGAHNRSMDGLHIYRIK